MSLRLRTESSCCDVYTWLGCTHRGSRQSIRSRESPIHLPWQAVLDRSRWSSPSAISADSLHLPIPTYLSRLSLPGRSRQIREPADLHFAYPFLPSLPAQRRIILIILILVRWLLHRKEAAFIPSAEYPKMRAFLRCFSRCFAKHSNERKINIPARLRD
jgi:hypothetical protein